MRPKLENASLLLTLLADLFFLWVIYHYALGGAETALYLLTHFGLLPWLLLAMVLFLLLYRSDYRTDLPLFLAGCALGYWGEWWGTTRGVWTYWNGAAPPDYLPPLWGIGLLTVYRLSSFLWPMLDRPLPRWFERLIAASFLLLPFLAFAWSSPRLAAVEWQGRLDGHFYAGLATGMGLVLWRFNLRRAFPLYGCGMLLGGLYEYLGTSSHEWTYITGEVPPFWIIPLWGLAAVAMHKLASQVSELLMKKLSVQPPL
ncbi:MAG: hypothetical protein JXB15_11480 [Anaerolineales bacterium]|nr:hypothetical protein [Anaerolineales bacterium]